MKQFLSADQLDEIEEIIEMKVITVIIIVIIMIIVAIVVVNQLENWRWPAPMIANWSIINDDSSYSLSLQTAYIHYRRTIIIIAIVKTMQVTHSQ